MNHGDHTVEKMKAVTSPLVDGVILMDPKQLEFKMLGPSIAIKEYAAKVDHYADALRYAALSAGAKAAPPSPDPSWPEEMQEAHKALYAELPQYKPPTAHGQHGYANANFYFDAVILNDAWMTQVEHSDDGTTWATVDPAAFMPPKEKRPWWGRFLDWLADKVF